MCPPRTPSDETQLISHNVATNKILVAEDNDINRMVIGAQLEKLGYHVTFAEDGLIGLEKWEAGDFALLLVDGQMPNMDGFSKTECAHKRSIVIGVTAPDNAMANLSRLKRYRGMDQIFHLPRIYTVLCTYLDHLGQCHANMRQNENLFLKNV